MNFARHLGRWAAVAAVLLLPFGMARAQALPSFAEVRAAHRPSEMLLVDRHGDPLQLLRVDRSVRRAAWLPLAEFSPALRQALILGEDRRFWEHAGIDWTAMAAAAWHNVRNEGTRGASTLTMQLAGLIEPGLARPAGGRSLPVKLRQMQLAREIEARWSKAQVLEVYLNLVPLRGELVGMPAAAQALLGKRASGLDHVEAALLAVLVRAPQATPAEATPRACTLLRQQALPCDGLPTLADQALRRAPLPLQEPGAQIAPHFARWWAAAQPGHDARQPLRTTIDAPLQRLATQALRQQLAELRGRNVEDGAVLVLDNRSGEVLAWVGSAGGSSSAAEVDAVLARRQPGSTLKPFVYAQALQQRLITPESLLLDAPLHLAAGRDSFAPRNYDGQHRGWVSAREALAGSLNVPAVQVARLLGQEAVFDSLQRVGLNLRQNAAHHGHALVLGSAETTLLELTNAYRALAQGGLWQPVSTGAGMATAPTAARRVWSAEVAAQVSAMLADPAARAASFGFDSPLVTRRASVVKTGTSKDMRDNWCVGSTGRYTVGVWIGNASGAPMHGVSGVQGAAPVWRQIVQALPPDDGPAAGLGQAAAAIRPGLREPFAIAPLTEGAVLALDPEIAPQHQRVRLTGPAGRWSVNGRPLGQGPAVWWAPTPGRHLVQLHAAQGQLVDAVNVEVRAGLPAARRALSPRRD